VLLTAREGALAWRPALDRLPRVLARHFESTGLLVVYPADVPLRTLIGPVDSPGVRALARAIEPEYVQVGLTDDLSEEEMLLRLLAPHAEADSQEVLTLLDRLRAGGTDYAVELRPGVAFYHAHTSQVRTTRLLVGTSEDGLHLPSASGPVHVVLIFLCPRSVPTDRYLSKLSAIAHLMHSEEQVEALRFAHGADQVTALLFDALRMPSDA
jgi:mannitol/fructose-specific phosphotransferase system IIA component (Ntr-type)